MKPNQEDFNNQKKKSKSSSHIRSNTAECRAEEIDSCIPYLKSLDFSIGGYLIGSTSTQIKFFDRFMKLKKEWFILPRQGLNEQMLDYPGTKLDFIQSLRNLHLGEWQPWYVNPNILDGISWSLELCFSNGHKKVCFNGSNAFPNKFEELCKLIGTDEELAFYLND